MDGRRTIHPQHSTTSFVSTARQRHRPRKHRQENNQSADDEQIKN